MTKIERHMEGALQDNVISLDVRQTFQKYESEVGGVNRSGADAPTGNPSPAPTHPHRTHDTTDQWREVVQCLG